VLAKTLTFAAIGLSTALLAPAAADAPARSRYSVELEGGSVWQTDNEVEIPNDGSATRFSLQDLVGSGPWAVGRVYFTWNVSGRHGMRVTLAPLSYSAPGTFDSTVVFDGATFQPGVSTEATYRFNTWRVGYRYRFHTGERWRLWVGFTGLIRDAEIGLEQPGVSATDTDLGFVPLLHFSGDWQLAERWRFRFELDALGGGPGRAEDVSLKLERGVGPRWSVAFGYRTLEGGADVEQVYNFAWFNYAVVSGVYRWGDPR
jgi:hypothetical protein